ncbi:MAG: hypothetical protein P4L61_02525 [Candidatus Pacebacteria bacterium]|nr:hypothetical protein [Candidatus Paceibacterota bacterium]
MEIRYTAQSHTFFSETSLKLMKETLPVVRIAAKLSQSGNIHPEASELQLKMTKKNEVIETIPALAPTIR